MIAPLGFCRLLNQEQTRGIAWLFDLYAGKTMRISDPSGRQAALQVQSSQVKWQWDYKKGRLAVRCVVEAKSVTKEMSGFTAKAGDSYRRAAVRTKTKGNDRRRDIGRLAKQLALR